VAVHAIDTASSDPAPVAAFAIVASTAETGGVTAEIWVSDRIRRTTVVQRALLTESDHARESAILAVRAVELLKASLAELWVHPAVVAPAIRSTSGIATGDSSAPPPPAPPDREGRHRPTFATGVGIGAGAGVVDDFRGVGAVWLPALYVAYGWPNGWSFGLALHGLGPAVTVRAPAGSASVEEQLATLDVVYTWSPRWAVVPFLCAGAGIQHVRATGNADTPYKGVSAEDWSLFTSAGAGAAVPLRAGFSLVLDARAGVAWPPTAVRIAGADTAHVGGPSLLADAHILGAFP
jgi:hypothetical protein